MALARCEVSWLDDSRRGGVRERRFDLWRGDRRVPGLLWSPADAEDVGAGDAGAGGQRRPLVLVGHGASGSKREGYVVALARRMVRQHGLVAAAIDGPVHGDRRSEHDPPPGLRLLEFSQVWAGDPSMTDEMVADWRATLDMLVEVPGLTEGPVGWWGLSMGTITGLPLVAAEPRISAAVLGLAGLTGPTRDRLEADAPSVRCPVLYLVQLDDEIFSVQSALELFEALGSTDKRLHAHPGRHGAVPDEELTMSASFLARRLR